ncbi:glycosyltransferase family 4 protein [archaeon]|nr:glycosyltransferase family 4 protein [archaeon]
MNKIKVYLQYPWKFPDSPYYKYLIQDVPEGIVYQNVEKQKGVITSKRFFWFSNFLKRNIRRYSDKLNLNIPNAHLSPKGNYDLIHCAHCLSKNKDKPWVADIEMTPSFAISGWDKKKGQNKIRKILLRKNCKKILPWAESIKEDILKIYPEIKNKVEVVYPAVPEIKNLKKPKNKKLKIIFVARYFDIKGGLIALEVLERLRQKYGITGIVISNVSDVLKKKYSKIKIYDLMPHKEVCKLLENSDLFLYPGSLDTFGFSLLEAMAFGLPIITINTTWTKSRNEIIENEKTGIIFDVTKKLSFNKIEEAEEKVIEKLVENTSRLIENKNIRDKMSKECIKMIKDGKFSIKERNKKLRKIYENAIKN